MNNKTTILLSDWLKNKYFSINQVNTSYSTSVWKKTFLNDLSVSIEHRPEDSKL